MGDRIYTCQWPTGCSFVATAQMKRGEHTKFMHLCTSHANQFMCMANHECADVSKRRTELRWTQNNTPGMFPDGARY